MIGKYNSPDFFKVHEFRPATLLKKGSGAVVFL